MTFEGIEGSGKSTQVELLAGALRTRGLPVLVTQEPGGTDLGKALRELLLGSEQPLPPVAELLIYLADRACHLAEVIEPALARGDVVLCDRFSDSTLAYQGFGRGLDFELVKSWDHRVTSGRKPDLTFLLDCPVEVGLRRVDERVKRDRLDSEGCDFHERVREGFFRLAAGDRGRIHVVDSTEPVDTVHGNIMALALELVEGH